MSYIRFLTEHFRSERRTPTLGMDDPEPSYGSRSVLIRMAREADRPGLSELAELDSAAPLREPSLLALVEDRIWAAVSLADGRVIADPFRPTSSAVALLRVRAGQLLGETAAERRPAPLGRAARRARA